MYVSIIRATRINVSLNVDDDLIPDEPRVDDLISSKRNLSLSWEPSVYFLFFYARLLTFFIWVIVSWSITKFSLGCFY